MLGAGLAFLIGRYLGRDFAASLIGELAATRIRSAYYKNEHEN